MALADYVTAAGWMRLSQRRDDTLVRYLRANPHSELDTVADALRRTRRATRRRLERLETEGRVRSAWVDGPVFYTTVYEAIDR
jgi:predicted ArsR family transcriptional regulator